MFSLAALVSGCSISSFDEDVWAHVDRAALEIDTERPSEPAKLDILVTFEAGPRASYEIALGDVNLLEVDPDDPDGRVVWQAPLAVSLPGTFDAKFDPDETETVHLVNAGMTNGDLALACGRTLQLHVGVAHAPDTGEATFGYGTATLDCRP